VRRRRAPGSANHEAQTFRDQLSGWHGHHRGRSDGKRRAEPKRIGTLDVEYTDDIDDTLNRTGISGS